MNSVKKSPHNREAEQIVLGASLLDRERLMIAMEKLSPEEFYQEPHKLIFAAMSRLHRSGINVDIVSVAELLTEQRETEAAGGVSYLSSLVDCIPVPIDHHCKIISDAAIKRFVITEFSGIVGKAYNGCSVADLLDEVHTAALSMKKTGKDEPVMIADLMPGLINEIEERGRKKTGVTGMSTGLKDLDAKMHGLQKSNYVVVAGRPGMGKTSLALKFAENIANDEGVLFFSMEMSNKRLAERLLCMGSKVDSRRVRTGYVSKSDWPRLTATAGVLSNKKLIIDHSSGLSIAELTARAKRVSMKHNLGIIVVDYIQLMRGSRNDNRARELAEISAGLLALSKDLNVCVVVLSQLNRLAESRTDKRPMVSDLKESGSIEQDADVVLLIYRDEVYNDSPDNPNIGTAEIIIGKGRDIGTWTVKTGFCGERTEFYDLATR